MSEPIVYPPGRCDVPFIRADDPALRDPICKNCGRERSRHLTFRAVHGGDVTICATTFAAYEAPKPPRRMAANLEVFANKYHRAEHDEHKSCADKPACQPVVPEPPAPKRCGECAHAEPVGGHGRGCSRFVEPIDATTHEREAMDKAWREQQRKRETVYDDCVAMWQAARRYVPPTNEAEERCAYRLRNDLDQTKRCDTKRDEHSNWWKHAFVAAPSEAR